jgi:hypothetical protein
MSEQDAAPRHPGGRPSTKTPELVEEIFERLARGEPMARICELEHMPSFTTVWRWEQADDEFRKGSARARELGTHYLADDCLRIADDGELDPADKRVRIDTRLRLIGKWNAKSYGDRIAHVGGGPGDAPIRHEFGAMTDEELQKRIDAKLAQMTGRDEPPADA